MRDVTDFLAARGPDALRQLIKETPVLTSPTEAGAAPEPNWVTSFDEPTDVDSAAFYGLAGEVVAKLADYTEAPAIALAMQFLAGFGNTIGHGAWFPVGAERHHPNLFVAIVGESGVGRKGSSLKTALYPLAWADPAWHSDCRSSGFSTGEGIIHRLRDPLHNTKGEVVDPGVIDKRLLIVETEFAGPLRKATRDQNTLTVVLRQAWDGQTLETNPKKDAEKATGHHVSFITHVTPADLRQYLSDADVLNGFANRLLWIASRRARLLPDPPGISPEVTTELGIKIKGRLDAARTVGRMHRSRAAKQAWEQLYEAVCHNRAPGAYGAATGRAEAQLLRLSMLYALTDGTNAIDVCHLQAALAVWDYACRTAAWVFGWTTGDRLADAALEVLRDIYPEGLKGQQLRHELHRSNGVAAALEVLLKLQLVTREKLPTKGRPTDSWRANPHPPPLAFLKFTNPP